jgi:restriction system-associated AAA family ATPase
LNVALEKLEYCATFCQSEEVKIGKSRERKTIQYDYWVNSATKEAFRDQFRTAYELFRTFYFLQLLNNDLVGSAMRERVLNARAGDIENLSEELPRFEKESLRFRLHNIKLIKRNGKRIEYRKLSDGEHQLLQVLGSLLLMDTAGALFLFDEPETHFNPDWRSKFVQLINKSIDKARQQELVLTTHSPFIISDCKRENVFVFERNQNGTIKKAENPKIKTYGTAVSIITDEIFNKTGTLSEMSLETIKQIKRMPMNTKENIQAAKEASRVLGDSPEKVLLFRELILKEEQLRSKDA